MTNVRRLSSSLEQQNYFRGHSYIICKVRLYEYTSIPVPVDVSTVRWEAAWQQEIPLIPHTQSYFRVVFFIKIFWYTYSKQRQVFDKIFSCQLFFYLQLQKQVE